MLVSAPYGTDAQSVGKLLSDNGYDVALCLTLADVAAKLDEHVGVVLITEEALLADLGPLHRVLEAQPAWSDVPFVLLAGRQAGRQISTEAIRRRLPDSAINVVLLERPLSSESLLSAISSAMRARQKQFEIRDQLAELESERAALASERTRLTTLLDTLPVGVAFVNPDGTTLLSNPEFRRFLPTGDIPSRLPDGEQRWEGYEADGSRITRDRFVTVRALKGERVQGMEFLHRPEGASAIWTRVSGIPLVDEGKVTGAISVIVDIDEQKRGQTALADAAQKLEQQVAERTEKLTKTLAQLEQEAAERERAEAALRQSQKMEAVGQLTGGIAHDFNNMLTGVIGAIDILKRRIATGRLDDIDRFMEAATVSAQRAAGLTARLLAFSRRQSLDSRATDVDALVGSLEDLLRRTISEQIALDILRSPDLPAAVVDANQLENAILNLAINARDAMPEGGHLTVETKAMALDEAYCETRPGISPGDYIVVSVSDTGVGVDQATLDKVFDPFFTTKPVGQGTGLGLSMVYGFAKQSNGQVRIHSVVGQGTTVSIFVPAADQTPSTEQDAPSAVHHGDGETVLLVEDDASVRMLVWDVLEELGYTAIEAAEPNEAIELLASGRKFDLMISDVGLPGMNGRQLAEVAREHLPDLPILFVTGYAENAAIRAGFLGTNMQMITKPFQIERLSEKISEMLTS
ncbi:hybrid sensor histidine kinase/response regulator [Sphingobium phenoxybenzoativorans]|uniref:hybrid sensor histidine kinase/response regulator n=1 Tax=Sphingobium phenoxybenzoativorans TaxID=1592790 RepID=UPI000A7D3487|nr:PAS domain-containing sensor histidine kinase [Sphingobium phenoxybenzoativorans]